MLDRALRIRPSPRATLVGRVGDKTDDLVVLGKALIDLDLGGEVAVVVSLELPLLAGAVVSRHDYDVDLGGRRHGQARNDPNELARLGDARFDARVGKPEVASVDLGRDISVRGFQPDRVEPGGQRLFGASARPEGLLLHPVDMPDPDDVAALGRNHLQHQGAGQFSLFDDDFPLLARADPEQNLIDRRASEADRSLGQRIGINRRLGAGDRADAGSDGVRHELGRPPDKARHSCKYLRDKALAAAVLEMQQALRHRQRVLALVVGAGIVHYLVVIVVDCYVGVAHRPAARVQHLAGSPNQLLRARRR